MHLQKPEPLQIITDRVQGDPVFSEHDGSLRRVLPVERTDIRPGGSVYLFRY